VSANDELSETLVRLSAQLHWYAQFGEQVDDVKRVRRRLEMVIIWF
jgi:hypothetical protein